MNALIAKNAHLGLRPSQAPKPVFEISASFGPKAHPTRFLDAEGRELAASAFQGYSGGRDVVVVVPTPELTVKLRRILLDGLHVEFTAQDAGIGPDGASWLLVADDKLTRIGSAPHEQSPRALANARALGFGPLASAA